MPAGGNQIDAFDHGAIH